MTRKEIYKMLEIGKDEKVKKLKMTFPAEELSGYITMLTKNGKVLIPVRKVPPEQIRKFPKLGLVINHPRNELK